MKRYTQWLGMLSLEFLGAIAFLAVWQPSLTQPPPIPTTAVNVRPPRVEPVTQLSAQPLVFPYGVQPPHSFWSQRLD